MVNRVKGVSNLSKWSVLGFNLLTPSCSPPSCVFLSQLAIHKTWTRHTALPLMKLLGPEQAEHGLSERRCEYSWVFPVPSISIVSSHRRMCIMEGRPSFIFAVLDVD